MLIIMALMMTLPLNAFAEDNDPEPETIVLDKQPSGSGGDPIPSQTPDGNRIPPRPILCSISIEYGIECEVTPEDILSYEIWSEDSTVCIATFADETDFVQQLFALPGAYQIRFLTAYYIYIGYISIL